MGNTEMRFYSVQGSTMMFLYTLHHSDDYKLLNKLYFELLTLFDDGLDSSLFFTFLHSYAENVSSGSEITTDDVKRNLIVRLQKALFLNDADEKAIRWLGKFETVKLGHSS